MSDTTDPVILASSLVSAAGHRAFRLDNRAILGAAKPDAPDVLIVAAPDVARCLRAIRLRSMVEHLPWVLAS